MNAVVFVSAIAFLLAPGIVQAQSKCDAGKRKEFGKKVFCLAKVDAKADKTGDPIDTAKQQKCIDKFEEKCARAEARDDCTGAVKTCAELTGEADTCRAAANGPGGTTTTNPATTTTSTTPVTTTTSTTVPGGCCDSGAYCENAPSSAGCGGVWFPGGRCDWNLGKCGSSSGGPCDSSAAACNGECGPGQFCVPGVFSACDCSSGNQCGIYPSCGAGCLPSESCIGNPIVGACACFED